MSTPPATVGVERAAALLGVSRGLAYAAARTGELAGVPVLRVGRRLLVPAAELARALGLAVAETAEEAPCD
jgi:hypothetical protein